MMRYIKPSNQERYNFDTYVCGGYLDSGYQKCSRHTIHAEDVKMAAFNLIKQQVSVAADMEVVMKQLKGSTKEKRLREKYQSAVNAHSIAGEAELTQKMADRVKAGANLSVSWGKIHFRK